jgi:predicted nuclease with TOPRIM domain
MDLGILVPLSAIGIGGLAMYFGHQRKMMELKLRTGNLLGENEQLNQEIRDLAQKQKALEERVQNLETISSAEPAKSFLDESLPPVKEHLEQLKTAGKTRA